MSARNWGNPPLLSTTAPSQSNPSTATLCAELILPTVGDTTVGDYYEVRWGLGGSTTTYWRLEAATSSGLSTTAIRTTPGNSAQQRLNVWTGTGLTHEFVTTLFAKPGDRFRAMVESTTTSTVSAWIQAEALT
jgi:hypothetical protein